MSFFRRLARLFRLIAHMLHGILLTLRYASEVVDGIPSEKYMSIKQRWLQRVYQILGVRVEITGTPLSSPALYVSNHISWLDIPVLGGQTRMTFLSKHEVRSWPIIGWLSSHSGTLFIKRGTEGAARQAQEDIERLLKAGRHILVFPEGTTTDGTHLRHFHPRLFSVAIDHGLPVQPVALTYRDLDGQLSHSVPFIDGLTFLANLWKVLGEPGFVATVAFADPVLDTSDQPRKQIANLTRERILQALDLDPESPTAA